MRTQINNILWYSKSHIIDRDENTIISVWHPAEHCRAPDWLSLTCYRCDVNSDRGGGGGDFGGKCVEEVRGVHSGLCQGTGGVLEPGPRGRKAKPGPRIQTQYSGYDVGGGGQLVDGGIYTSVPRTHLFVIRELMHHEHLEHPSPSSSSVSTRGCSGLHGCGRLREGESFSSALMSFTCSSQRKPSSYCGFILHMYMSAGWL